MATNSVPLMGHLVLGYPDLETSLQTARTYAAAGLAYLELQLPFSHPTADGTLITEANRVAVAGGTTLQACLAVIRVLKTEFPAARLVAMTYANRVFATGTVDFCEALAKAGAEQLIVPDLALDSPLAAPLRSQQHLSLIPVIGPNTTQDRLNKLLALSPRLVYLMSGYRLTGSDFTLDARLAHLVALCRAAGAETGIGFGVSAPEAVRAVLQVANLAIVGSALLRAQQAGNLAESLQELCAAAQIAA